jgi:hypothetical protein
MEKTTTFFMKISQVVQQTDLVLEHTKKSVPDILMSYTETEFNNSLHII